MMPKKRRTVKSSIPEVYAGQVWLCAVSRRVLRIGFVVPCFYFSFSSVKLAILIYNFGFVRWN